MTECFSKLNTNNTESSLFYIVEHNKVYGFDPSFLFDVINNSNINPYTKNKIPDKTLTIIKRFKNIRQ